MNHFMELWSQEFQKKGIPSSFRQTPANSVIWFEDYLKNQNLRPGHLLDLGAGKGRNGFHLANNGFQVSCIDLLQENIDHIRQENPAIDAKVHDLSTPFPYKDNQFDYAIDIYSFKFLTTPSAIKNYIQELKRVLKPGAIYHLSLASIDDGFYGPLLSLAPNSERLITDPHTQIQSILYTRKEVEKLFAGFNLLEFYEKRNLGPMHGKLHARCVLSFLFEYPNTGA